MKRNPNYNCICCGKKFDINNCFPCPVCGEFNFHHMGNHDVCEVCGWENDLGDLEEKNIFNLGPNILPVDLYKIKFKEFQDKNPGCDFSTNPDELLNYLDLCAEEFKKTNKGE